MRLSDELKAKPPEELEEWFLENLEAEHPPIEQMLAVLLHLAAADRVDKSRAWAELLQETLDERGDADNGLKLLQCRCSWNDDTPEFRRTCAEVTRRLLKDRYQQAVLKSVDFKGGLAAAEAVRRLQVLRSLRAGVFCHDKTWGFGVVRGLDDFYGKVTIDFRMKPGHQMSFAYAAEALELVGEDHLYARLHSRPDELLRMVREEPGEIVRIALRSYGPMSAPELQERLTGGIVPADGWKAFWDGARKQLKEDPLVDLPARRNEAIRLRKREKEYDADWFAALSAERDPQVLYERFREVEGAVDAEELSPEFRAVMAERLAFSLKGCEDSMPALAARFLLAAERLKLSGEDGGDLPAVERARARLLDASRFPDAATALAARDLQSCLAYLAAREPDRTGDMLIAILDAVPAAALEVVVDFLAGSPRREAMAAHLRAAFAGQSAGIDALCWAARHLDKVSAWALADRGGLVREIVDALGMPVSGESLKARKQLLELIGRLDWLSEALSGQDERQRLALFARVRLVRGWDEAERRSLMGRFIKLFPELEAAATPKEDETAPRKAGRLTSWRSYRERQEALRKLVEETIPENSREIGVARSYGDLRENFEYQSAKDLQRLLMQRRKDLENELAQVQGTDFSSLPADKAGIGTCVTLAHEDGRTERYCILGEWDRDEQLGIISSKSKLAEVVEGCAAGDEVVVPGSDGEQKCRVVEVTGLSDEARRWASGG